MKQIMIWCLVSFLSLQLVGCSTAGSDASSELHADHTEETNSITSFTNPSSHLYPSVIGSFDIFPEVDLLIRQTVDARLRDYLSNDYSEAGLTLMHSVTLESDNLLCILFEGTYSGEGTAHPSNFAFSVCVSRTDARLISPLELFTPGDDFMLAYREQLLLTRPDRFDEETWHMIVANIESYSNAELASILCSRPEETLCPSENGIIVLFPVASAAGDYVKIEVPFLWK